MHFNDLHLEIIRMIFYIHVYGHLGSKRTLLHTCRTWYNLASNDPILWKDITLIAWDGKYPLIDRCKTLDDLVRNISRTRKGTFNLTLELPATPPNEPDYQKFTANMDRNWLSRCRSLTLRTSAFSDEDIGNIQRTVDAVLSPKRRKFAALEHLVIHNNSWGRALDSLLRRVACSSPNLQSLELADEYYWDPCDIATRMFRHVDILRRIRRLHLASVTVPVPWVELTRMEHLDYTCINVTHILSEPATPDSSNLFELVAPCLTSLCLEGDFGDIELPSHRIFNQIAHLILRDFSSTSAGSIPSSFLHLSSLGIQTSHSSLFFLSIDAAPVLEELTFAAYDIDLEDYDIIPGHLTPRVLRLDIIPLQRDYIEFGRPHKLWSRLEELHLTVHENVTFSLAPILERALCNERLPSSIRSWYPIVDWDPRLHTLTVLYPYTEEQEPTEAIKRGKVAEVRDILVKRCDSGLDPLETVKLGWYKVARGTFLLGRPFTEWTVIEWRDCLDDWTSADYLEDMPE